MGNQRASAQKRRAHQAIHDNCGIAAGSSYQRMGSLNISASNANQRSMRDGPPKILISLSQIVGFEMARKMKLVIGAAVCTGLLIILVPEFAHEIAAAVMPSSKSQSEVEDNIRPRDPACAHAPWPFGCDWGAPIGRKKIARKSEAGHRHHAHTATRQVNVLLGSNFDPQAHGAYTTE